MGDTCDATAMVLNYILVHCTYNHMPTIPLANNTLAQVVNSLCRSVSIPLFNVSVAMVIDHDDRAGRV